MTETNLSVERCWRLQPCIVALYVASDCGCAHLSADNELKLAKLIVGRLALAAGRLTLAISH